MGNAVRLTQCGPRSVSGSSIAGAAFILVGHCRLQAASRFGGARESIFEHPAEILHLSLGKKPGPEEPYDFELFLILGDLAREMETRRASGAHAQLGRESRQRDVRDR